MESPRRIGISRFARSALIELTCYVCVSYDINYSSLRHIELIRNIAEVTTERHTDNNAFL